jgi:hypothetical protein
LLSESDVAIAPVVARLAQHQIEATFLVPTQTALTKSIIDAHEAFRDFLRRTEFHDFERQERGTYRYVAGYLLQADRIETTKVSLYRPRAKPTKKGDPRVCVYGLKRYANAKNLLAVVPLAQELYVINASDSSILDSIDVPGSPLWNLARRFEQLDMNALELLGLLKGIANRGFVSTMRKGDTGVGFTLESLLGIAANTSQLPDYKGIEVKAARYSRRGVRKHSLYSQAPNWNLSKMDALQVLRNFGYHKDGRLQLYVTVSSRPNKQGLFFDSSNETILHNLAREATGDRLVVCWEMSKLIERLERKHPATMWVKARCRLNSDCEEFHYIEATYTRRPLADNLLPLIQAGSVTMEYTLSLSDRGTRAEDHGYLFKIKPADFGSLFPAPRKFQLVEL